VVDRFTEFDGEGRRYNDIQQTMGFNFITVSWTKPLTRLPGWNFNVTAGAGPTRDGLSRFLQNDVEYKFRGLTEVPVGQKREANDFMLSSTLTRWFSLFGSSDVFFAAGGTIPVPALRYSAVTFETWNDLINQKDCGPTFGARLTFDRLYTYDRWFR